MGFAPGATGLGGKGQILREEELEIRNADVRLAGTLTLPEGPGPWPVVLCLHGSGPLDRNENLGRAQRLDVFNTIAADLAPRGIATLRFDKRGCGKSNGNYCTAGHSDLLADAAACLRILESDPRFSARFALGHSAGTVMAAQLSLEHALTGLVLLNPFVESLETTLIRQAESVEQMVAARRGLSGALTRLLMRIFGSPREGQRRILAKLKFTNAPVIRHGLQKLPAKWFREMLALDTPAIYARVHTPALILGGGKDLQCNPADVGRIADLLGDLATRVLIDGLTHILRRDPDPASFAAYARLMRQPMDAGVVRIVGEWLGARAG